MHRTPIAPSGRELAPQVPEGASGRCSSGLLEGWYVIGVIKTTGEVPSLAVKWAVRPLAPSGLGLRPKPPPSRREVLRRAAAVNACKVQLFSFPILLGNDTGRVREVTIRRKPPCEIVCGRCPPIPGKFGKSGSAAK